MSCKPTYKGVRYNSLEELYNANGVNTQQAQQRYSQYLEQNPNGNVEQFKKWVEFGDIQDVSIEDVGEIISETPLFDSNILIEQVGKEKIEEYKNKCKR